MQRLLRHLLAGKRLQRRTEGRGMLQRRRGSRRARIRSFRRELEREFWLCAARLRYPSPSRRSLTRCSSSLRQLLQGVGLEFSPRRGGRDPAGARTGGGGIRGSSHVSFGRAPRVFVACPRRAARSRGAPPLSSSYSWASGWSSRPDGAGGIRRELGRAGAGSAGGCT